MSLSSNRRLLRRHLRSKIQSAARRRAAILEPALWASGHLSQRGEQFARRILDLAPQTAVLSHTPRGDKPNVPLRMTTQGGQDLVAKLLAYRGWRGFEYPLPAIFESLFRAADDGLFFDVGANTGVYSLLSKWVNNGRSVHAFEPYPLALEIMSANIRANIFAENIVLSSAAASDRNGMAEFYVPTQEHGLVETSASLLREFKPSHSDSFTVHTVKLDDYVAEHCEGRIALVKIDTEGNELDVLRGFTGTMDRDNPVIVCEILPGSNTWKNLAEVLDPLDYAIAAVAVFGIAVRSAAPDPGSTNFLLFPKKTTGFIKAVVDLSGLEFRTLS